MAENLNISETFAANEITKQFNLTDKFEGFAKNKGLNEQGIQIAKEEIQKRLDSYNSENNMKDGRFNKLLGMMESFINNEIAKAKSVLVGASKAFEGVSIPDNFAEKVETTPNSQTKVAGMSMLDAVRGGFEKMITKRKNDINNVTK